MRSKRSRRLDDKLVTHYAPQSPAAELFRTIRTNIRFAGRGKPLRTILVTSAQPGEGKTLTSANLAVVLSQNNIRTVYVDADMRRPTGHHSFRLLNHQGLSSYLVGDCELADILQESLTPHLSVVTAGPIPPNPLELLETERLDAFLAEIGEHAEAVIIDSPPLVVSDAAWLASKADGCVLVVDAQSTGREAGIKAVEQLRSVNARILGAVLNNVEKEEPEYYY